MKRDSHDDDLPLAQIDELRSRIDESLTSLDHGKGTDGEEFMQGILTGLDLREVKHKVDASNHRT